MPEAFTIIGAVVLWVVVHQWMSRVKGRTDLHDKLNAKRAQLKRDFEESCR